MYINPFFLSSFLVTKSRLSLSNTEIVFADHVNCEHFLAIVCNSCDWSKCFNTKIHPLKVEFKYIFFRKQPFCKFMHSLRKNENISMWGKRVAPQQKKLLPFLPGSLLNAEENTPSLAHHTCIDGPELNFFFPFVLKRRQED